MNASPLRLPDAASIEAVVADLDPASADDDLVPALARAFPGFEFSMALIDDHYWRDTRSVIRPDGTCLGEMRPWMTAELIKEGDDVEAPWRRLKETDLQITEWRGTSAFVLAPTGPAAADYIQIALGRESEWRAGPIVNPDYRPLDEEELFDPSRIRRVKLADADRLNGPVYRLLDRAGGALVHLRSFLGRCDRIEHKRREAKRPELERRVIQEIGPDGAREIPFLEAVPDWFAHLPRELRFFEDWEQSSASAQRRVRALGARYSGLHRQGRAGGRLHSPAAAAAQGAASADAGRLRAHLNGPNRRDRSRARASVRLGFPDDPWPLGRGGDRASHRDRAARAARPPA